MPGDPTCTTTGLILGIETSCDETAAAVVRNGTETLSSVVASQIDLHAMYGGVVPELASREHLRNIVPVVREALARAGVALHALDAIAVTNGPGLAGALLVGITYAKSLSFALGIPLLPINHLEGHIYAVLMEHRAALLASQQGPLVALVVSGGHTHLYRADPISGAPTLTYQLLGRTVDDAAGEAFDKVAKLLGLPYPGGPWIDALAPLGNPLAIPFRFSAIKPARATAASEAGVPRDASARAVANTLDLSFSGIKTAVLRHLQAHELLAEAEHRRRTVPQTARPTPDLVATLRHDGLLPEHLLDLAASFQHAVVGRLLQQTFAAADRVGAAAVLVTGGVAANRELRTRFSAEAARRHLPIAFPALSLATDNAAMIAAAAWPQLLTGNLPATDALSATPQLRLETPA